jgi:hypothetical protein
MTSGAGDRSEANPDPGRRDPEPIPIRCGLPAIGIAGPGRTSTQRKREDARGDEDSEKTEKDSGGGRTRRHEARAGGGGGCEERS